MAYSDHICDDVLHVVWSSYIKLIIQNPTDEGGATFYGAFVIAYLHGAISHLFLYIYI